MLSPASTFPRPALIALLLAACDRTPPAPVAEPAPPATSAFHPEPLGAPSPSGPRTQACVAACIQARQMEAVGVEVIEASCRSQCAQDPAAYPPGGK